MDGKNEIDISKILDLHEYYLVGVNPKTQWEKYLMLVKYAYNNTVYSSTSKAAFDVIKGHPKVSFLLQT